VQVSSRCPCCSLRWLAAQWGPQPAYSRACSWCSSPRCGAATAQWSTHVCCRVA